MTKRQLLQDLKAADPDIRVIADQSRIKRYATGIRFGHGAAIAVIEPSSLLQFWTSLKVCLSADCIVICQAANTGVT
ncbi:MAG: D-lactate dehydrogenase, partial [Gammaproteobacteria bacterium]|nr:D-lactate dehydrogenase [Gammaproteobacteria bacterium]